jgi:hypothetical protein
MGKKSIEIKKIVKELEKFKKKVEVDRLIFFGSLVRGQVKDDSDIDLILISRKFLGKKMFERPIGLHFHWKLDLPVDFLCYTPNEFNKLRKQVSIAREALLEGIEIK